MRVCKIDGCNEKHKSLGYCCRHYQQYKKYGYIKCESVLKEKECLNPECKKEFVPREDKNKYCSLDCKVIHYKSSGKRKEIDDKFNHSEKGRLRTKLFDQKPHRREYHRVVSAANRFYAGVELSCIVDGCINTDIHKHHEDYSKPYEIIPMCHYHHNEYHKGALAV